MLPLAGVVGPRLGGASRSSSCCASTCTSSRAGASRRFREGVVWSIGWLVRLAARRPSSLLLLDTHGRDDVVTYTTVYFDRALAVARQPVRLPAAVRVLRGARREYRARLLFWGIAAALVLRGRGDPRRRRADRASSTSSSTCSACCCSSSPTGSCAGWRRTSTPTATSIVRLVRRVFPVTGDFEGKRLVRRAATGARFVTPLFVCLAAIVARRHRVRGRLDPGRVRDHARLGADLDGATSSRCSACARCSCSSRA